MLKDEIKVKMHVMNNKSNKLVDIIFRNVFHNYRFRENFE